MSDQNLDAQIRRHYSQIDLRFAKKREILRHSCPARATNARDKTPNVRRTPIGGPRGQVFFRWLGAAVFCIVGGIGFRLLFYSDHQLHPDAQDQINAAVKEVAVNFNKNRPSDFMVNPSESFLEQGISGSNSTADTQGLQHLAKQMPRLDFSLVTAANIPELEGHQIVGGRYCKIQGNLAAQIQLQTITQSEGAQWQTAYIARPANSLSILKNFQTEVDGVVVSLFQRNGLVYALARKK